MNIYKTINELKAKYATKPETKDCYKELMDAWNTSIRQLVEASKRSK